MLDSSVLDAIRELHEKTGELRAVHRIRPALYARARRAFGSWRSAVTAAGLDYAGEAARSLRQGLLDRDQRRAVWRSLQRFLLDHPGTDEEQLLAVRPELARRMDRCFGSLAQARAWAAGQSPPGRPRPAGRTPEHPPSP
jgi:hypothetical protein